jgi:hypothetical protein
VYGLEPAVLRRKIGKVRAKKARDEYRNDPQPRFATYGPRTRREFLTRRELLGDTPWVA